MEDYIILVHSDWNKTIKFYCFYLFCSILRRLTRLSGNLWATPSFTCLFWDMKGETGCLSPTWLSWFWVVLAGTKSVRSHDLFTFCRVHYPPPPTLLSLLLLPRLIFLLLMTHKDYKKIIKTDYYCWRGSLCSKINNWGLNKNE